MYRDQLDQVRRNTGDIAERAERILDRRRREAVAAAPDMPAGALESMAETLAVGCH
jgi:hypothetical protein